MERRGSTRLRREEGSALFVAVMMLVLMGFLGLAALDRVMRDEQVAGFQNRARTAFYAGEAAVAEARSLIANSAIVADRSSSVAFHPDTAPQNVGDVALYDREGGSLPRYYGDPTFNPSIRYLKDGPGLQGGNLQPGQGLVETLWQINVVGLSPDGSRSRIEVVAVRPMASTATGYH
jgi:hypothetical protein